MYKQIYSFALTGTKIFLPTQNLLISNNSSPSMRGNLLLLHPEIFHIALTPASCYHSNFYKHFNIICTQIVASYHTSVLIKYFVLIKKKQYAKSRKYDNRHMHKILL